MFVDEVTIKLTAGKGGDGCTSFRREKYVEMGGPNGGNGGKGADIIFKVDKGLRTLIDLRYKKNIKADKGTNGEGKNRNGKKGDDLIIFVPEGTTVIDADTNLIIADLINDNDEVIVAKGGRGGRGNTAFATHDNPAPKMSEYGEPGEERLIKCELKVLADVGLVGMPSVGKSTILGMVSAGKPKAAPYHFTTLSPNLGVIKLRDERTFVMADLPGLIENASSGAGLGIKFLQHAMRCKIIAHVVDMGAFEGRNPIEDYKVIRGEIEKYNEVLANKKEIVIANKMDLENYKDNLKKFKSAYPTLEIIEISAEGNIGLDEMLIKLADLVYQLDSEDIYKEENYESHVIYRFQKEKPYTITNDNGVWVIKGKEIETLFKMTKFGEEEAELRFTRKLRGMGIEDELERLGAVHGDEVQILDYIFLFKA